MPKESKVEKNIVEVQRNGNFMMNDKQHIGLIPNVSYNAFILGSNINISLHWLWYYAILKRVNILFYKIPFPTQVSQNP